MPLEEKKTFQRLFGHRLRCLGLAYHHGMRSLSSAAAGRIMYTLNLPTSRPEACDDFDLEGTDHEVVIVIAVASVIVIATYYS